MRVRGPASTQLSRRASADASRRLVSSCLRGTPCASVPVCLPAPLGISIEVAMIISAASYRWTLPRAQLCAERCPCAPLGSPATAPRSHRTERGTGGRMPCSRSPAGEVIQATSESPGLSHPGWRISTWTWEPRLRAGSMSLCARARWFHAPPAGELRSRDSACRGRPVSLVLVSGKSGAAWSVA